MNRESFQILVLAADDHLTQEVTSRVRQHFSRLPLQIDTETSGRRTVSEFRQKLHDLVILAVGSALDDLSSLVLQLQSVSGSSRFLVLSTEAPSTQNIDFVQVPILKWDTLLDLVTDCVPEHLATRHRLTRLKSPARIALENYAQRYQTSPSSAERVQGLALAPRGLMLGDSGSGPAGAHPSGSAPPTHGGGLPPAMRPRIRFLLNPGDRRRSLLLELAAVSVLIAAALGLHWFADPDAPSQILSLKNVVTALAVAGTLGFFGARALDRIHFSDSDPSS